jgi:hypothetical protein
MATHPSTHRGRLLVEAISALRVLRRGRWTVAELSDELGIHWRAGYRLLASLRAAGVTVEVSREHGPGKRGYDAYYQIPAEPLRRLLRLR